jgi:hypothetical protein
MQSMSILIPLISILLYKDINDKPSPRMPKMNFKVTSFRCLGAHPPRLSRFVSFTIAFHNLQKTENPVYVVAPLT